MLCDAVGKQRAIEGRKAPSFPAREQGFHTAFPYPSYVNSQIQFLYLATFHPLSYWPIRRVKWNHKKKKKERDTVCGITSAQNRHSVGMASPFHGCGNGFKTERREACPYLTMENKHILWDVIEREWKWAQSQEIRRWTQMGLFALSIQLSLAKYQTQWQAIRTDGNRTWRLPWGIHSLGVGKQMEEQISYDTAHQRYHIITQGLKEPTPNSLKPANRGWEAGVQRSRHSPEEVCLCISYSLE